MAFNHGQVPHLLPQSYKRMVAEWLEEDCPSFDYGGFVVGEEMAEARLLGKSAVGGAVSPLSLYFFLGQIRAKAVSKHMDADIF